MEKSLQEEAQKAKKTVASLLKGIHISKMNFKLTLILCYGLILLSHRAQNCGQAILLEFSVRRNEQEEEEEEEEQQQQQQQQQQL